MYKQNQRRARYAWTVGVFLTICLLAAASYGARALAQDGDAPETPASFPGMMSYQGVVKVSGIPYNGSGYFKFAIVDASSGNGSTNYWANDGTASGEPSSYVGLTVSNGLFDVYLGDSGVMSQVLSASVFTHAPTYLRVWFSQSTGGPFTALEPNQRIAGVGYSFNASLLEGQDGAYYQDASNLDTGTLNPSRFSAYTDLSVEGYLNNQAGDLARNNSTLQASLNADLLDGESGDFYQNASNINAGTLNSSRFSAYTDLSSEGYLDNEFGDLAKNNGTLQPFLNADLLDGESGAYYRSASNLTCGTLSTGCYSAYSDLSTEGYLGNSSGDLAQNNGTLQSNLNADRLDNMHGSDYLNASNLNAGTLSTSRYSAYSDLQAEGKIGEASSQLAQGDHDHMEQSWSSSGDGLEISTTAALGYAFKGTASGNYGLGVWALAGSGTNAYGLWAESDSSSGGGVYSIANASSGSTYGVYASNASSSGHGGHFVTPNTSSSSEVALWAGTFYGNIIEGWETNSSGDGTDRRFRVTWDGDVYADGTYYGEGGVTTGSADFAEMLTPGEGELEAGDVLAIDAQGKMVRSSQAYQKTVIGVYSSQPGFIAGNELDEAGEPLEAGKIPVAVVGVVPVKAGVENGAIQAGDLLVASSTPGIAMKAGEQPEVGTVIGKALEALEGGQGLIRMMVMLQ